jgi:hypothetical protein
MNGNNMKKPDTTRNFRNKDLFEKELLMTWKKQQEQEYPVWRYSRILE